MIIIKKKKKKQKVKHPFPYLIAFFVYLSHLPVFLGQIVVGPTVHVGGRWRRRRGRRAIRGRLLARAVSGAQGPFGHQFGGHGLQVVRPPDQREHVDDQRGQVQLVVQQLGVLVVPRERVMVVVPPVAARGHRHQHVLGGIDVSANKNNETANGPGTTLLPVTVLGSRDSGDNSIFFFYKLFV